MSHEEYQQALQAIISSEDVREATRLYDDVVAHDYPRSACETRARALHERLERIISRVERLDPPADAATAQKDFLTAGRQSVDRIGDLADEVARGEVSCGRPYNERAYGLASTDRARRAVDELVRHGYLVFGE